LEITLLGILLQKNPYLVPQQNVNFILVDIYYAFSNFKIEVQVSQYFPFDILKGNFPDNIITKLAEHCGIEKVKKHADSKAFYCWSLEVPYGETTFGGNMVKSNMQHNMMNVITWMHNELCYEVC
jgi:hypothetical protein